MEDSSSTCDKLTHEIIGCSDNSSSHSSDNLCPLADLNSL